MLQDIHDRCRCFGRVYIYHSDCTFVQKNSSFFVFSIVFKAQYRLHNLYHGWKKVICYILEIMQNVM